ncbi:MAG: DUF2442 domain-containing protein [Bacteroidia bacterium]
MEGIKGIKPVIKKVKFDLKGKISVYLKDGRIIISPIHNYPSLKKLSIDERKKFTIVNDQMLLFKNCNEIYHIQDFLGVEQDYVYAG